MCCKRRRDQGAIIASEFLLFFADRVIANERKNILAPVVITSTQHHVGGYPVTQVSGGAVTTHGTGVVVQQHTSGTGVYPMPQPMPG